MRADGFTTHEARLGSPMITSTVALMALAVSALTAGVASAGAWTREAGTWFVKFGYDRLVTDQRYDESGRKVAYLETKSGFDDNDEFRSQALRFYAEYGWTEDWTAIASTSFERVAAQGNGEHADHTGLSDLRLQLKRRLVARPIVVSVTSEAKLPTGYSTRKQLAIGTGAVDAGGLIAIGGSTGKLYWTGESGYIIRGGGHADEFPFAVEAGYEVLPDVVAMAQLRGVMSARVPVAQAGQFDPARADSRYLTGGLALVLRADPLDIVLGVDRMLSGKNTLAGSRLTASIWYSN